jgi:hypothetical protein
MMKTSRNEYGDRSMHPCTDDDRMSLVTQVAFATRSRRSNRLACARSRLAHAPGPRTLSANGSRADQTADLHGLGAHQGARGMEDGSAMPDGIARGAFLDPGGYGRCGSHKLQKSAGPILGRGPLFKGRGRHRHDRPSRAGGACARPAGRMGRFLSHRDEICWLRLGLVTDGGGEITTSACDDGGERQKAEQCQRHAQGTCQTWPPSAHAE